MLNQAEKRIMALIAAGYTLVIVLVIALALLAISGMNNLQSISRDLFEHPFTVNDASLEATETIALIRDKMLLIALSDDPKQIEKFASEIPALDKEARNHLDIVKASFLGDMQRVAEAEILLNKWPEIRSREIDLSMHRSRLEAIRLITGVGAELFNRLDDDLDYVTAFTRLKAEAFVMESERQAAIQINRTVWFLAALIMAISITGWLVARRVLFMVRRGEQMEIKLLENEHQAQSAAYARSLIEAILDPLVTINPEGKITDVNQATEQVTGRSRAELIGTDFSAYFTEPDQVREGYQQAFANGFVTNYPLALHHLDGRITDVLYNASVYRNEAGEVLGVFAAARDVTERKNAEFVLRQSEDALKEAQRMAHVGSWHMDLATNQVVWSEVLYQMYGFDPALPPPLYTESMKLFTPESWERLSTAIARAVESGIPYELELEMVPKDGDRKWMLARGELVRDASGAPVRVRGVVMDITERKLADNAIREKEERLVLATVNNGVGIWDWNLQTQKMIWDDSMYALYHIRREDFSGTEEAWRASLHPDDLARGDQEVADAISGNKPFETEFRVVWPNGEIHYIKAVAKVFRDDQGIPLRMLGINMDVTDHKKAEEELRKYHKNLEELVRERTGKLENANEELEAFSYSVSHDLRTPLRAIDGFSLMLLEDYTDKLDDEGRRLLNVVRNNTSRMSHLIDDILHFSRVGRIEISYAETDMAQLVRDVRDEIETVIAGRQLQINIGKLPKVFCDRAMMHQVIENLLSNAIKFSAHNEDARIDIDGRIEDGKAIYSVKDNGVGFDMQYAAKLFGVFQRLHRVDEFEGTGIGLAIVKRIISRHGGTVWAESEVGRGANFYFAIPVSPQSNPKEN